MAWWSRHALVPVIKEKKKKRIDLTGLMSLRWQFKLIKHFAHYGITISLGPAILWPSCVVTWWILLYEMGSGTCLYQIDTVPQWILWKRSSQRTDPSGPQEMDIAAPRYLNTTRVLVLHHLLQVKWAAVLCTFSTCWIWVLEYALQIGAA